MSVAQMGLMYGLATFVFLFSGMLAGTGIFGPLAVPAELGVIGEPEVLGFSSRVRLYRPHDKVAVARG